VVDEPVERYLIAGLRLGRHIDGLVDAYYGPPALADGVADEPVLDAARLVHDLTALLADLDGGVGDLDPVRRRWLRAQTVGLHTTAERLAGVAMAYADEVERSYGVRPAPIPEDELLAAHRRLDEVLPGRGSIADRSIAWREAHAVPVEKLREAVDVLLDDFRRRTSELFGLPDGEHVAIELVANEPWSGFNYYEGDLRSRVAINTDLPVLSLSLGHLIAHEAYPGHHTEHTRKEAGLVRQRRQAEETIFCVGTPQCLLAEGLADLAIEILIGPDHHLVVAELLRPLGLRYDAEVATEVAAAGEALAGVRANLAWMLNEEHRPVDEVVAYAEQWALLPRARAEKAVEFLTDPTWRAYIHCYIDGVRLCRAFVDGDPARFERLITEQLIPDDLG